MRIAAGTIVLNQNPSNPMSGEIVRVIQDDLAHDPTYVVAWADGQECEEIGSDVTLTGHLILE